MPLTAKQQRFVAEYSVDLNATQAAIRAGYAERSAGQQGHALMKNPEIARAIQETTSGQIENAEASAQWIVDRAVDVVKMGLQAVPVLDKRGNPTGQYEFDGKAVNGALALLAKRHPEFSEKHEVKGQFDMRVLAGIAALDEDSLRRLAMREQDG